jgi:Sec-independent protein secretion pathway component TatC
MNLAVEAPAPPDGDPAGSGPPPEPARGPATRHRRGPLLTGRGAITGMLLVFFIGVLAASGLHWGPLAGGSFLAGSAAAAWYTKRRDLLTVAVSPPLLFFIVVVCVKALTADGNTMLSTVEGTALTLANVAPWLFTGVALSLIIAWFRGLPRCVAELRRELRPDLARRRPGGPAELGR